MMSFAAELQQTHNARELKDLPLAGGGVLRSGVLFRSDALAALTPDGVAALGKFRIGTVADLRTDAERARAADVLPTDGSVVLLTLPMLGGAMDEMVKQLMPSGNGASGAPQLTSAQLAAITAQIPTLAELYIGILGSSAAQFATLARAVIAAASTDRPGVLFHCTAGKDRTGVAAALLLWSAGVSRGDIVADYALTEQNLARGFAQQLTGLITSLGVPLTPELRTLATESPAPAIEAALDWVQREHGGIDGYWRAAGLDDGEIDQLAGVLTSAGLSSKL